MTNRLNGYLGYYLYRAGFREPMVYRREKVFLVPILYLGFLLYMSDASIIGRTKTQILA